MNKLNKLYMINELACHYFTDCLYKTGPGAAALEYFHNRGITDVIIERFSLGFSLPSLNALELFLTKKRFSREQLMAAGLIREKNGSYRDMFVNRVIIPIKNPQGKIIAFGGRVIDDSLPKYLNTGETAVFQKRETLFGLDVATKSIMEAKEAIVVEGYMDAISLHAAEINRVVASLGTAFSEHQAKLLHRLTDKIVFAYDSDETGQLNAVRAVSIAKKAGLSVKVLIIPKEKDPDAFVRKFGKEAFENLVKYAGDGSKQMCLP